MLPHQFSLSILKTKLKKKITIRDVAAKLGLSAMTVSLALRDHPRISLKTKQRIRVTMDKLGYKPSHVARALATGKSNLLGVIVPNSSDLYYAEVIRAIEDKASAENYHVLLANGSYDMDRYTERVRDMMGLHVGGIIAAPPFTSERPKLPPFWQSLIRDSDFDVVLINRELRPPIFHQVAADYTAGVRIVVEALAERPHSIAELMALRGPDGGSASPGEIAMVLAGTYQALVLSDPDAPPSARNHRFHAAMARRDARPDSLNATSAMDMAVV